MSSLLVLATDVDWTASGGLFDWTLEFLIDRLSDGSAVERLREVLDNNLGSLWVSEFPVQVQKEICDLLRRGVVAAAEQDLPAGDYKAPAMDSLRELAALAQTRLTAL